MNIVRVGVTNKSEDYKGFTINWQEPPLTSASWTANVASNLSRLQALIGSGGAKVIDGRDHEEMTAKAKAFIDGLLE